MSKIWLITGCSTGIGRSLSKELLHRRQRVIATARNPDDLQPLIEINPKGLLTAKLDVTNPSDITEVVKWVRLQGRTLVYKLTGCLNYDIRFACHANQE